MRLTMAVLVMVWWSATVAAQSPRPGVSGSPMGVPLPRIGLPLPPIGLPFPPVHAPARWTPTLGLPVVIDGEPLVGKPRPSRDIGTRHRRFGRKPSVHSQPTAVFLIPAYGLGYLPRASAAPTSGYVPGASSEYREQRPLTGTLRLEVQPEAVLQLYVDGYYVGTPNDFNSEVELEAGPHTIEIRAPEHETLQFDVNIAPHRSTTYRGSLQPASAPPRPGPTVHARPDVVPVTPTTFYLIPGCYAGNVPPKDAGLPATCDHSRVITFKP